MAKLEHDAEKFFKKNLDRKSRVLLINPPVQERRYHWIRWNQPTELLRLSSWLKQTNKGIDVRLTDFMFPDEGGAVQKHKVKPTWTGPASGDQLWHFGTPLDEFEGSFGRVKARGAWVPDLIVVSSLTSYWHRSIELLLTKLCQCLGPRLRKQTKIVLYGNYPRIEPKHAAGQRAADVALTRTVAGRGCFPDFALYSQGHCFALPSQGEARLPNFYALDIEDSEVEAHLAEAVALSRDKARKSGQRQRPITATFFNDDLCGKESRLSNVVAFASRTPNTVLFEGLCGLQPKTLTRERIDQLGAAGFRSLFIEHARLPGGELDLDAYAPILDAVRKTDHAKKQGQGRTNWLERGGGADRGGITGFVNVGLPDDDMDALVHSTLLLNRYFQSIILKPFGYSPTIDSKDARERGIAWPRPCMSSPHWFPYAGRESALARTDYDNLMAWQNVLNKRVKGTTFDFLDTGNVARLVRETLVAESWKPKPGVAT